MGTLYKIHQEVYHVLLSGRTSSALVRLAKR